MTLFQQELKKLHACSEARKWVGKRTLMQAWAESQRGDWVLWLVLEMNWLDDRALRLFACDCAERVLPIYEKEYPDDDRPRKAIAVARLYADGKATQEELDAARAAAEAADRDATAAALDAPRTAASSAALAAALSAARVPTLDVTFAAAGAAAWDAADRDAECAADRDAAWDEECAWQAEHLRSIYTPRPLEGE